MHHLKIVFFVVALVVYGSPAWTQTTDSNIKTFGYFQISFDHQKDIQTRNELNSFRSSSSICFCKKI